MIHEDLYALSWCRTSASHTLIQDVVTMLELALRSVRPTAQQIDSTDIGHS